MPACGEDAPASEATNGPRLEPASLMGNAARIEASNADAAQASAAINAFSADLFDRLVAADPTANLVFSPASIAVVLTMVSAGAKEQTLAEMHTVLHITDPATIHRSMNGLSTAFASVNQSVDLAADGGTGTNEVQLSIANSLWGQADVSFQQAFLDVLSSEYGAGMELVDYKANPEAARVAINAWVDEQTQQRIPELLREGMVTDETRLTLVNAIYLKANWATAFPESMTTTERFAAPGGELSASMMHTNLELEYGEGDEWRAVEIPYVFRDLSLLVAMGDAPDTVMPSADEAAGVLMSRQVELGLPKFDIETKVTLKDVLSEMGMPEAFSGTADFTGMTDERTRVNVGNVIHQANITVDEEGTEAAGATAIIMSAPDSMPPEPPTPVVFTIDRPFTFWLRHRASGTVIFAGRVNDPSATR